MNAVNPRRWRALVVLAAAQFMVIMDTSIIGVALPDMQRDLGFTQGDLQWVFNAYVVAFGGLLLLGGRLSDLLGARKVFTAGWAILIAIMIFMIGITARLLGRFGAKPLIVIGLLVLAAGVGGLALVRPDGAFVTDVLPASLVAAVGMSLAYIPAMMSAMSGARPEESGLASGIVNTTYHRARRSAPWPAPAQIPSGGMVG